MSAVATETPHVRFEDLIPNKNLGVGYVMPNEDIQAWRELVKGLHIRRAGGICSGGEVGFFSLLPSVREELVLVDHNYQSLKYAITKYIMLQRYGFAGTLRLLRDETRLRMALAEVKKELPEALKAPGPGTNEYRRDRAVDGAEERFVRSCKGSTATWATGMPILWEASGQHARRQAIRKLAKVKFLHGDFVTIAEHGPFDVFYMSNAHESGNGNARKKDISRVNDLVSPGGHVLVSCPLRERVVTHPRGSQQYYESSYSPAKPDNWELVRTIPRRDLGMTRWTYNLYKVS